MRQEGTKVGPNEHLWQYSNIKTAFSARETVIFDNKRVICNVSIRYFPDMDLRVNPRCIRAGR